MPPCFRRESPVIRVEALPTLVGIPTRHSHVIEQTRLAGQTSTNPPIALMAPRVLSAADRDRERQRYRTKLAKALTEEDDPLAVYYQFVEWTLKHYGEKDPKSGLTQLLEEATRVFKDDKLYKTDLRYLKLWSLHARQVSRADAIAMYASLISNDIGTSYSILYEEYANLLAKDGRCV